MTVGEDASRLRIVDAAEHLLGLTAEQISMAVHGRAEAEPMRSKSFMADLIEGDYFGVDKNSRHGPDFAETGIELKVTPLHTSASGRVIRPKERLVIAMVDYDAVATHERWEDVPQLAGKLDPALIIWYDASADDRTRHRVVWFDLWRPSREQARLMQVEYERIRGKVLDGERLSGGDGSFLSTCPKHGGRFDKDDPAASSRGSLAGSHPTLEHAQRRAWQIKPRGMTDVLSEATGLPVVTHRATGVETEALYDLLRRSGGGDVWPA
jgi:DNA mismatch repair enzyme MutH.